MEKQHKDFEKAAKTGRNSGERYLRGSGKVTCATKVVSRPQAGNADKVGNTKENANMHKEVIDSMKAARIEAIRREIANGTYFISAQALSAAILEQLQSFYTRAA